MDQVTKRSDLTVLQRQGLERLEACAREGLTIRAFAKRRRLPEQQLYQISKVLRRKGLLPPSAREGRKAESSPRDTARKPSFVEVQASATRVQSDVPTLWRAHLPNGVVLEGSSDLALAVEALSRL
jgi:hypothetical protein